MIAFDLGLLEAGNEEQLRYEFKRASREKRQKMMAALFAVYGQNKVAEKLGTSDKAVKRARGRYPDIEKAACLARHLSIAELAERKTFQLINSIDVNKVEEREKARSAKLLADVADLQYSQLSKLNRKEDDVDTEELIYRVKRRLVQPTTADERSADNDEVIDVTSDVIDNSEIKVDAGN